MNIRNLVLTMALLSFYISFAQSKEKVIYATTSKNVNIFFQSPINTAIVGSTSFSFGFNKESKSDYGILKAIPGQESNLLVTTENGNIFSFIIRYKKEISELNYFIDDSLAIGNTSRRRIDQKPDKEESIISTNLVNTEQSNSNISKTVTVNDYESISDLDSKKTRVSKSESEYENDRNSYYKKICTSEVEKDRFFLRFFNSSSKVYLRLKNIRYDKDELYFTLNIDNQSSLDYDIDDLSFFIIAKNKTRRTSSQRIAYEPVFIHNAPERVEAFTTKEVVYVFKKFSINSEKVLQIVLSEFKGERNILLEINNSNINNPN